jgi:hypothetical protein
VHGCDTEWTGKEGRMAGRLGPGRRSALCGITELWRMCGHMEGEWIGQLLEKQLGAMGPGETVEGWPGTVTEIDFVEAHVDGECEARGRGSVV